MSSDGINVNNEKKVMYFLLANDPLTLISYLIEFFTSTKIIIKKSKRKIMFIISKFCKFFSVNDIKLLSINVKNVKKPINKVAINTKPIKIFFLIKSIIVI